MLFFVTTMGRTRSNDINLHQEKVRLENRRNFLIIAVVQHLNRLPEEIVDFKSRLDRHLTRVVMAWMILP